MDKQNFDKFLRVLTGVVFCFGFYLMLVEGLPALSPTASHGAIVEWVVEEGDMVLLTLLDIFVAIYGAHVCSSCYNNFKCFC